MLLISWLLACLAGWTYGRVTGDWWPLVITVPSGPVVIWLHRHGFLM